jgi:cell division protein FtsQ
MELLLERNPWIADAEIYLDNNRIIHAVIRERLPIARIFTMQEHSFYIDSAGVHLPLSDKMATRVPVFTDFPSDQPVLAKPDSLLFADIIAISKYIAADSFWMAQVSQIAILPGNQFEMYLLTGTPTILLGDASDLTEKFHKLDAYFRSDYFKMGYGKYGKLSAQYRRQLIGIRADSLRQRASIDSAGFYRALQGIEQGVAQQTMAGKNLSELPVATTPAATANSLTKTLISSDKNIEKSYNKSRDSALSNKAQLRSNKTGRQGSAKINPPQQKNKK